MEYLTIYDIQKKYDVGYETVRQLFKNKGVPGAFQVGSHWLITIKDWEAYIAIKTPLKS